MKWIARIILTLVVIAILLLVGLKWFYLRGPIPEYGGDLALPQLSAPVDVYTDAYGVPHVYAENEEDLFFATGYLQASERLYKMDVIARAVEGRFAEVLGPDLVSSDKYLRTWGFYRIAKTIVEDLDDEHFALLQRAADGINAYIDGHLDDLPVEFKVAGYKPLRWRVEHMIGYSRLMGHDLTLAWMPEIVFGAVVDKLGEDMARELYPVYPDTKPYIVPRRPEGFHSAALTILNSEQDIRSLTGGWGSQVGSNSWVVHGSRTVTGKPLLANDPHLGFTQPAVWYEMHLVGGRFDVAGVTLAGIPLVVIGQNQSIAWGYTNVMTDDMDFYVEKVDPGNPDRYLFGDEIRDMTIHLETIKVKDAPSIDFIVRETHHGPIVNDIHETLQANTHLPIAMCWAGKESTTEVSAMFDLNVASNWEEFTAAVQQFKVPGQNIIYADTAGNIGWRPATMLPRRAPGTGLVPLPGEDPQWDWQGYIPAEELPFQFNPPEGFIATANNRTIGDEFPHYISAYWEPPARANRIVEMLSVDRKLTVADMQAIQNDVLSDHARDLVPLIIHYGRPAPANAPEVTQLVDILAAWDYVNGRESVGATVFNAVFINLIHEIYGDEMADLGHSYMRAFLDVGNLAYRNVQYLLELGESEWFDDHRTADVVEGPREIMIRSLRETAGELKREFGRDPTDWCWHKVHTLTHPHPMAEVKLLDMFLGLNVGPFAVPGNGTTVNCMQYELYDPYQVVLGPSMRHIHDLSEFTISMRSVMPTGQSGHPASPHYADQAVLYNTGGYRYFPTDMEMIMNLGYKHRLLHP